MMQKPPCSSLLLASTFYVGPIEIPIRCLLEKLGTPLSAVTLPYGNVVPALLDPCGELCRNVGGVNVLLLRPEDCGSSTTTCQGWIEAIRCCMASSSSPMVIAFAPPAANWSDAEHAAFAQGLQQIRAGLSQLVGLHWLQHREVMELYPVAVIDEPESDISGYVRYTREYWAALATALVRKITRIMSPAYKIIVLDCDNTLWQGICGEQAPGELRVTHAHREFQERLVALRQQGMLLCLCSKNNPCDVDAVFAARSDMPLRREHIVSTRINWTDKPTNIRAIAAELNLGLDAIIFVDDSPVECAQVLAGCPQVLTLQVPTEPLALHQFLRNTWEFDSLSTTQDGQQRNARYQDEKLRTQVAASSTSLISFIDNLRVEVRVSPMLPAHLERVAELVARTNQFNLTTRRRSANAISELLSSPAVSALVVHVADRFGEYGLTGAVLLEVRNGAATVDTFLLSCRVLGRGVETKIVNHLGDWATDRGLRTIEFQYRATERNQPAFSFVRRAMGAFERDTGKFLSYEVPAAFASGLTLEEYLATETHATVPEKAAPLHESGTSPGWRFAPGHSAPGNLAELLDEIEIYRRSVMAERRRESNLFVKPDQSPQQSSSEELALAAMWCDLLALDRVTAGDNFTALGADSLLVIRLINRIAARFAVHLTISSTLQCHTLHDMAELIGALRNLAVPIEALELERGYV